MKTILILVGKTVNKHFIAGIEDYSERISHYMPFEIVTIPELRNTFFVNLAGQQKQQTARRLVFVIGGPYGFSDAVYSRSNEKISLSKMTFSHQMVRLIFTEQLYRACTIIKGEPYHHE